MTDSRADSPTTPETPDEAATPWASLTATEQMVARLAAEALTNRQIASRMFLSPHTVNFHLRKIFRKLGIRSRIQLVRLLVSAVHAPNAYPDGSVRSS